MRAMARSYGTLPSQGPQKGYTDASGPIVIKGKLIQGLGFCERYKAQDRARLLHQRLGCANGKLLRNFHTMPKRRPRRRHLGHASRHVRAGGETWTTGSYDPDLNLTYRGVAQAKPWMQASRGTGGGDAASYYKSTLALRPDTGQLAW